MISALGIRTLRYPVLWESVSPIDPSAVDWSWHDERLARLRDLGISPVVGLVHHGSGPRFTNLLDPNFAEGLAAHAAKVAERYPWIEMFTPVNEPLTTARFSCLYGIWHPHRQDYASFLKAVVNQCRGIVFAMRAIRRMTPHALLVSTEDICKVFSTAALSYQAEHENERRWLSLDLLCGRVGPSHPWYSTLLAHGIDEADLEIFFGEDGEPDIIGMNHYLTSERYLDHHLESYPERYWGGNGRDRYADVEAVRVPLAADVGAEARITEIWDRYHRPLAITEAHLGSTADEQIRWLVEIWQSAERAKRAGVDIRAVTAWSLFGAVDWNSLLTAHDGYYEAGAIDVQCNPPSPTPLARAIATIAKTGTFQDPLLRLPGWWRKPDRYYEGSVAPERLSARWENSRLPRAGSTRSPRG